MAEDHFVSLYRRFRPQRFDELMGQDHVVRALRSAVRDDRVSHAYLFSGPRGTGKTSSARILAKALNCAAPQDGEPCGECTSCCEIALGTSLNVHELDAASNNGVESMRDLVAHAGLGTPGRWKIYIIDEVHMLSTAAANALLKTLEEPPGHVVFVLATTDPQKVPETIRSRTQHLEFRLLGADVLRSLLQSVNTAALLDADDASVQAAVRRSRGSARDALSALDQLVASGSADAARPELTAALDALGEGDAAQMLVALSSLLAGGWGPQPLALELVDDLRQVFLAALAPELCSLGGSERERFTALAERMGLAKVVRSMELLGQALVDMRDAPDPQVVLEIAVVRASRPDLDAGVEALSERVSALERQLQSGMAPAAVTTAPHYPPVAPASATSDTPTPAPEAEKGPRESLGAVRRRQAQSAPQVHAAATDIPSAPSPAPPSAAPVSPGAGRSVDRDSLTEAWGDGLLRNLPARIKALYSAGRFVAVDGSGAQFALPNAAHRDRCAELSDQVEKVLSEHFGSPVRLVLVVDNAPPPGVAPALAPDGGPRNPDRGRDSLDELDEIDPAEMRDAAGAPDAQASAAEARLLEAFPGASEVTS